MNVKSNENTNLVKFAKSCLTQPRTTDRPLHQAIIVLLVLSLYSFRLFKLDLLFCVLFSADTYPAVRMDTTSNSIWLNIPAFPLLPSLKCSTKSGNANLLILP